MKKEHKIWWEGIADQYEEWASNPPKFEFWESDCELYTCKAFYKDCAYWGFNNVFQFDVALKGLFKAAGYADLTYPIGEIFLDGRETKREAFCQDMADTIWENIQ